MKRNIRKYVLVLYNAVGGRDTTYHPTRADVRRQIRRHQAEDLTARVYKDDEEQACFQGKALSFK